MKSLSRLGMKTFWEPIPRNGWWISTWPSMHLIILGICRVTIIGRHWSIIITRCAGTISFYTYINVLVTNQGVPIFNSAIIAALRILELPLYLTWRPTTLKLREDKSSIMWKIKQAMNQTWKLPQLSSFRMLQLQWRTDFHSCYKIYLAKNDQIAIFLHHESSPDICDNYINAVRSLST